MTCKKTFRPVSGKGDARRISELLHGFVDEVVAEKDAAGVFLESIAVDSILEKIGSEEFDYWISCDREGRAIGVVGVRRKTHLYHLFVDRAAQGTGIGSALFRHAQNELGDTIKTVNASINAVRFYEKLGFTADGEEMRKDGLAFLPMSIKQRR